MPLALEGEKAQFVLYSLANRQPVEFVSQSRADGVELPFLGDEASSGIYSRLKWTKMDNSDAMENTIAVVNATGDQRVDEHSGVVSRQRTTYCPQLSNLIETIGSSSLRVLCKCQLTVDVDAQTGDNRMTLQHNHFCPDL